MALEALGTAVMELVAIQDFLGEAEGMILLGAVVQRIVAAVRRFDAQRVCGVVA